MPGWGGRLPFMRLQNSSSEQCYVTKISEGTWPRAQYNILKWQESSNIILCKAIGSGKEHRKNNKKPSIIRKNWPRTPGTQKSIGRLSVPLSLAHSPLTSGPLPPQGTSIATPCSGTAVWSPQKLLLTTLSLFTSLGFGHGSYHIRETALPTVMRLPDSPS